jgi:hypothetical protein
LLGVENFPLYQNDSTPASSRNKNRYKKKRQRNDFVGPSKNVPIETQDKICDGKTYVERPILKKIEFIMSKILNILSTLRCIPIFIEHSTTRLLCIKTTQLEHSFMDWSQMTRPMLKVNQHLMEMSIRPWLKISGDNSVGITHDTTVLLN